MCAQMSYFNERSLFIPSNYRQYTPSRDMSTSTCWSLWQRMPPRYQLTARISSDMEEELYNEERAKSSPRARSPRRVKTPGTPRQKHKPPAETEVKKPTIAGCDPTGSCHVTTGSRRLNFPNRKSGYIDHYKTQQRVNSARVKFSMEPPSPPYQPKEKERATTAPTFPLTSSSRLGDSFSSLSDSTSHFSHHNMCSQHRESSGLSIIGSKSDTDTQSCIDTEDKISVNSYQKVPTMDVTQRKFNVRETDEGTMYIDNGKIIFFKKSRHNPSVLLKSKLSDGSFLASIRREYLSKPKVIAMSTEKVSPTEERLLQRERVYYNQKVGHILDYYCMEDEDRLSMDDINKYTQGTPRTSGSPRQKSPKSPRVRRIYFDPSTQFKDGSGSKRQSYGLTQSCSRDELEDPNLSSYMKVNRKLKLHDRKFYLRTPHTNTDSRHITQADIDNCKCGICRIEMQLSLMAQLGISKGAHVQTLEEVLKEKTSERSNLDHGPPGSGIPLLEETALETKVRATEKQVPSIGNAKEDALGAAMAEPSTIEVTVPGMNFDREVTDSGFTTARTLQSAS